MWSGRDALVGSPAPVVARYRTLIDYLLSMGSTLLRGAGHGASAFRQPGSVPAPVASNDPGQAALVLRHGGDCHELRAAARRDRGAGGADHAQPAREAERAQPRADGGADRGVSQPRLEA